MTPENAYKTYKEHQKKLLEVFIAELVSNMIKSPKGFKTELSPARYLHPEGRIELTQDDIAWACAFIHEELLKDGWKVSFPKGEKLTGFFDGTVKMYIEPNLDETVGEV